MQFCENCENLLVIRQIEDEATGELRVVNRCLNCGSKLDKELPNDRSIMIISKDYRKTGQDLERENTNIKHDPRLPRVNNIKCINKDCKIPKGGDNEVIYILKNKKDMVYKYICVHCDTTWTIKK